MTQKKQEQAAKALHSWYQTHGRHELPWRNTRDPYAIWVSEIMLQQTQVATVKARYYEPFLEKFPTVQQLAKASLEDVLAIWEGLGYYRRARHLHAAAQATSPSMPRSVEELIALPGIGKNTAHAIASFAYGTPVAVMEANVKRILARMHAATHPTDSELWQWADSLLNKEDPFTHNQAMMDIGATLCTPKAPQCEKCPLSIACKGKLAPESYPQKKQKKIVPTRNKNIIAIHNDSGDYWLAPRQGEFLHGLYGFIEQDAGAPLPPQASHIGEVHQTYSHFKLYGSVYTIAQKHAASLVHAQHNQGGWFSLPDIASLPLSRADSKSVQLLPRTTLKN